MISHFTVVVAEVTTLDSSEVLDDTADVDRSLLPYAPPAVDGPDAILGLVAVDGLVVVGWTCLGEDGPEGSWLMDAMSRLFLLLETHYYRWRTIV